MESNTGMKKSFWDYHHAFEHRMSAWKDEVLFTWQWWFGIILTIMPWIIWYFFRKKESTDRLMHAGIFVSLISLTLDNVGFQFSAWTYFKPVTPVIPAYMPFDFALMPVAVMFLIQYFFKRNPWIVGLIFGIVTAFVGEPFFKWIQVYNPVNWKFGYSIPFYTVIYLLAHKLALRKKFNELS